MKQRGKAQERAWKRILSYVSRTHTLLYRMSGGVIGGRAVGLPVALLTTTGRKSGLKRVTPVTYLAGEGGTVVLLGSQTGMSTHPQWYFNMRAHPEVEVQIRRRKIKMIARQATTEERPALWGQFSAKYAGFNDYAERTEGIREIPVMILEPCDAPVAS